MSSVCSSFGFGSCGIPLISSIVAIISMLIISIAIFVFLLVFSSPRAVIVISVSNVISNNTFNV